jgi:hypothetical protein
MLKDIFDVICFEAVVYRFLGQFGRKLWIVGKPYRHSPRQRRQFQIWTPEMPVY